MKGDKYYFLEIDEQLLLKVRALTMIDGSDSDLTVSQIAVIQELLNCVEHVTEVK